MQKNSILLVDDEEDLVSVLGALLTKEFDVTTASGPDQALSCLKDKRFSLILTDLNMPGTGSRPYIAELVERAQGALIVCMSGNGPEHVSFIEAQKAGARGLILKPFGSSGDLIGKLREYLGQHR